jgi:hypothetical protein
MSLTSHTLLSKLPSQKFNAWILWFQFSCIIGVSSSWKLQSLRSADSINRHAVSAAAVLMWSLNPLFWKKGKMYVKLSVTPHSVNFYSGFQNWLPALPDSHSHWVYVLYSCLKTCRNLLLNLYKIFFHFFKTFKLW